MSLNGPAALRTALFAFLSGVPALVYQVVWTREVALVAGSQVEAISVVLVAFFGGLALGADRLGGIADRVASPLRFYGALEIASGLAAAASISALRLLGERPPDDPRALLAACGAVVLPVTFLLGGTLPALLRTATQETEDAARHAGWIVGANTAGAVTGVTLAVLAIPAVGLRLSQLGAGAAALAIGVAALALGRKRSATDASREARRSARPGPLIAAALVGAATLGYEVLATRLAMLRLGSSLYAWGLVLGLFLAGLALGNLALANRARSSPRPARDLGWIEVAAACAVALGVVVLRPDVASPASGLSLEALSAVLLGVLPAAFAMGAAFPFLVRLAVAGPRLGASFGLVSAVNTAGGIAGALLAPFALLPALGALGSAIAFAVLNAIVGLAFLAQGGAAGRRLVGASLCLVAASAPSLLPATRAGSAWVLFLDEGRQTTTVVTSVHGRRTLIVDGDTEASTAGDARRTEELLAVLPLLLHPRARSFLEVGLGSGITLGTAGRFPLERRECVEISRSVIRAARYFEPDNRGADAPHIVHSDARVHLARNADTFDIIAANTLHPWSVGATGLYSHEYFERLARALRPAGIAVQWLPTEQIGGESLALILRTFYAAFPHGGLWWGAGNLIAVGTLEPLSVPDPAQLEERLEAAGLTWEGTGVSDGHQLRVRRIAGADAVRNAVGTGDLLHDDRPVLEVRAANRRRRREQGDLFALLVRVAQAGLAEPSQRGAMLLWLESLQARAAGDEKRADGRESLAAAAGLRDANRARARRLVSRAQREFSEGRPDGAAAGFQEALAVDPENRNARLGLALLALNTESLDTAARELNALLDHSPNDPRALNELTGVLYRRGELEAALRTSERALRANPFYLEALANSGLMSAERGDLAGAEAMLTRIRAVSPLGASPQEQFLASALARARTP